MDTLIRTVVRLWFVVFLAAIWLGLGANTSNPDGQRFFELCVTVAKYQFAFMVTVYYINVMNKFIEKWLS